VPHYLHYHIVLYIVALIKQFGHNKYIPILLLYVLFCTNVSILLKDIHILDRHKISSAQNRDLLHEVVDDI
jgi:hypothetical protein